MALFTIGYAEEDSGRKTKQPAVTEESSTKAQSGEKTWEEKELKKHGLSKDSTPAEIRANKNKPTMKEMFNW